MTVLNMVTTYVGITQVLNGQLTLGGYMAFSTLSGYFTSPVSELIGSCKGDLSVGNVGL